MKKIMLIISLAVAAISLNSCMAGYVASEPSYVEYSRPVSPNNSYIWIDGGWGWNSQSQVYVQRAGYWDRPRPNETYRAGSWHQTPKGKTWTKGSWQKNNYGNNRNTPNDNNSRGK